MDLDLTDPGIVKMKMENIPNIFLGNLRNILGYATYTKTSLYLDPNLEYILVLTYVNGNITHPSQFTSRTYGPVSESIGIGKGEFIRPHSHQILIHFNLKLIGYRRSRRTMCYE